MIVISLANQKGGVGKSAISTHQSMFICEQGKKVIFIDNDIQGNSTGSLQLYKNTIVADGYTTRNLYDANFEHRVPELPSDKGCVYLVPGTGSLAGVPKLDTESSVEVFSKNVRAFSEHFDYCIIDNGPSLGLPLLAALTSSDYAYSPIEVASYSFKGVKQLDATIKMIQQKTNPNLKYLGLLPNRFNTRSPRQKEALKMLFTKRPDLAMKIAVVERSSIEEALATGVPVWSIKKSAAKAASDEILKAMKYVGEQISSHEEKKAS